MSHRGPISATWPRTIIVGVRLGGPAPVTAHTIDAGRSGARKGHIAQASSGKRADKLLRRFSWEAGE